MKYRKEYEEELKKYKGVLSQAEKDLLYERIRYTKIMEGLGVVLVLDVLLILGLVIHLYLL